MSKTLTYEQLKGRLDREEGITIHELMKHFLVIAMQNEFCMEKMNSLDKRVASMDEELYKVSEMQSGLKQNIERQVMTEPNPKNPIESSLKYQVEQGLLIPKDTKVSYNCTFEDPQQQKAFLSAVHAMQFIDPTIQPIDVFEFLTM